MSAVGSLIVALLGTDADLEPIPARRWLRGDGQGWTWRSLLLLADHACAEPATRRPNAKRLAAAIAEAVPGASAAPPAGQRSGVNAAVARVEAAGRTVAESSSSGRAAVLVVSAVAALVLGGIALRLSQPVDRSHAASAPSTADATPTSAPTLSTTATSVLRSIPPTTTATIPLVPPTITFEGRRYEIGRPGDLAVLGDWDGDLVPTPALLRPSTGEVFVFPRWATVADLVVDATLTVPGAVELVVAPGGDRDQLTARRADGSGQSVV